MKNYNAVNEARSGRMTHDRLARLQVLGDRNPNGNTIRVLDNLNGMGDKDNRLIDRTVTGKNFRMSLALATLVGASWSKDAHSDAYLVPVADFLEELHAFVYNCPLEPGQIIEGIRRTVEMNETAEAEDQTGVVINLPTRAMPAYEQVDMVPAREVVYA